MNLEGLEVVKSKARCLLDDLRCDDFAGPTPGGKAVENHEGVIDLHRFVKVLLAVVACQSQRMVLNVDRSLRPRCEAFSGLDSRLAWLHEGSK